MFRKDESLLLEHPKREQANSVRVLNRQPVDLSGGEIIERLTVELAGSGTQRERIVSLVVKHIGNVHRTETEAAAKTPGADVWVDRWKLLKEAGIPVVPMVRRVADDRVAMTDLEADGSVVYGKADLLRDRGTRSLEHVLLKIPLAELKQQAFEIGQRADEMGIMLASDDALAVVVRPDGSWQLIALDIGFTQKQSDFLKRESFLEIGQQNVVVANRIVTYIDALQKKLGKKVGDGGLEPPTSRM